MYTKNTAPNCPKLVLSSKRSVRVLIVLLIFMVVSILNDFYNDNGTQLLENTPSASVSITNKNATSPPNTNQDKNDHFSLCGRKLYYNNMPYVPTNNQRMQYGILNWKRSLDKAISLDPRISHVHGRTGNQIRAFFHAFDWARDAGGPLVMHSTGYPMDTTLSKLYLGLSNNYTELESRLGILLYDNVDEQYRSKMYSLGTRWARDYVSTNPEYSQYDMIQHRHYIIQQLYEMSANEMERNPESALEMCKSFHAIFGTDYDHAEENGASTLESLQSIGITKRITKKYTIIHSRSFEGKQFLEESHRHYGVDSQASIDYPPDLIASILSPLNMTKNSILMITDGQDESVAQRLLSDPIIGPNFHVVPQSISTMSGDILLAIFSEVFIGNPASSFSQYITMVRYALGFDKSYLYVRRDRVGDWDTFCDDESCFYYLHDLEAQTHQPSAPKTIP